MAKFKIVTKKLRQPALPKASLTVSVTNPVLLLGRVTVAGLQFSFSSTVLAAGEKSMCLVDHRGPENAAILISLVVQRFHVP
jgi:hypothetical protein